MDIPRRVCHNHIEFAKDLEVKVSHIAVDPLSVRHPFTIDGFFLGKFSLLILLNVMDQLAVRIVAGIEMWAVAESFICVLVDNGTKMFFAA